MNAIESGFESQLDALKVITLTDGEVWSARDLMPFAGYSKWENWSKAISRAITSVNASGLNAADHFAGVGKMIELGKGARREVEDVELTRYACYILFQNADGAKTEVAAAQQYFAIKTRAAEVSPRDTPSGAELIALAVIEAQQMLAQQASQIAELAPKADAWDGLASGNGTYAVADAAKMLNQVGIVTGRDRLFQFMHELGWVYRQSGRWQAKQTAVGTGRLYHKPQSHQHPETGETVLDAPQVRVTMKGLNELRKLMLPPFPAIAAA
ncbi:hypothetical protein ACI1US_00987 [Leucobacter sp. BZR 635]